MGAVDSIKSQSVVVIVAFILILIANLLSWISFTTTSWGVIDVTGDDDYHYGLWRLCRAETTTCIFLDGYAKVWYNVVQAFAIFGFVGINVACLIIILYIFMDTCKKNAEAGIAAAIICFVTAVFWLLAVIIFGAEFNDDDDFAVDKGDEGLGFSFILAIFALVFEAVAGVLMVVASKGSS